MVPALTGCVSPWASAPPALSVVSETASWDPSYRDLSAEAFDGEGSGEMRRTRRPAKRSASSTSHSMHPAPVAPTSALTHVASTSPATSPDILSLAPPPVDAEAEERARLTHSMDERYRRWNGVAHRAIRSICSG